MRTGNDHWIANITVNIKNITNDRILLANSIFNDFRPTRHAIRQAEQHYAPNFDRISVGFWLILPTDWNSPTVSDRFQEAFAVTLNEL